jgi:hypothetical protein
MAKPPKKEPTEKLTPATAKKLARTRQITQMEGDADRSDGRNTRVHQRGRLRS